ncbi:hypothetical protein VTO42DRAFT_458 [Malbranchea cinnamomea]
MPKQRILSWNLIIRIITDDSNSADDERHVFSKKASRPDKLQDSNAGTVNTMGNGVKRARSSSDVQTVNWPEKEKRSARLISESNPHAVLTSTKKTCPTHSCWTFKDNESEIRLTRLTRENWLYILAHAQTCVRERERAEQFERQQRITAGCLAGAEAELKEMRDQLQKQTSQTPEDASASVLVSCSSMRRTMHCEVS